MTNRASYFSSESCLALLMPSGPATPTDRRAANGAPRVLQLSFSFRRPLCRRGIVLDLPHGGLNPAHVSFRLAKTRHSSRAPPPHLSYPCNKPPTPPRTFGAFSERIGGAASTERCLCVRLGKRHASSLFCSTRVLLYRSSSFTSRGFVGAGSAYRTR